MDVQATSAGYATPDNLDPHEKAREIEARELVLEALPTRRVDDSKNDAIALHVNSRRDHAFPHASLEQHAVPVVQLGVAPPSRADLCPDDVQGEAVGVTPSFQGAQCCVTFGGIHQEDHHSPRMRTRPGN